MLAHWMQKTCGSKKQPHGALCRPVWVTGVRLGWKDSAGALICSAPWLCSRHWEGLWLGQSLQGELLSWQDGVAEWGGDKLLGGEWGERSLSAWELDLLGTRSPGKDRGACLGSLNCCVMPGWAVVCLLGVPGELRGAEGARADGCHTCWRCLESLRCHFRREHPGCGEGVLLSGQLAQAGCT